ncbi:MAG: hypothetical protein Q9218_005678 [Villophora microphyllina]
MLSPISLSLLLLLAYTSTSTAQTQCFTQIGNSYTKPSISTHRISTGISCHPSTANGSCPLNGSGYITESPTLNITTPSHDNILTSVSQAVSQPFDPNITGACSNVTQYISHSTTGYISITPTLICCQGTLGPCFANDAPVGSAIEACTPRIVNVTDTAGGFRIMDGVIAFVETDEGRLSEMTTNPSKHPPGEATAFGMTRGNGSGIGTTKSPRMPDSGASGLRLAIGGAVAGLVGVGAIFWQFLKSW